jgi:calcineurin-like phosphoesterase family protein
VHSPHLLGDADGEEVMKTWAIADTHFFHHKLVDYCGRPEDFTEQIIQNWCNMIAPGDLVYHLGDVGFYKKADAGKLIQGLPGHKILIRGNHDRYPIGWYLDHGFMAMMEHPIVTVRYQKGIKRKVNFYYKVILSHSPVPVPEDVDFNLHGHFHNNSSPHWEEEMVDTLTPKHRLMSIEESGYCPMLLDEGTHHDRFINSYERAEEVRR